MTIALKPFGQPKVAPEALLEKLFRPTGIDGVYGRTGRYEHIVDALQALISRHRDESAEILRFPPVVSRALIEKSGYLKSFPHLLGCVCSLGGGEREIGAAVDRFAAGEDWTGALRAADVVLSPAACYPVYPLAASRGLLPKQGYLFDVACDCFRREPSRDIDRFQSFRMREYVRIGGSEAVQAFRKDWIDRGCAIADALGLAHRIEAASDPFFGRGGIIVAKTQEEQELKFELLVPVKSAEKPTACMSFNYHRDHFGLAWSMRDTAGQPAHTACAAFGVDRLAVALFASHGAEPKDWPSSVRQGLAL